MRAGLLRLAEGGEMEPLFIGSPIWFGLEMLFEKREKARKEWESTPRCSRPGCTLHVELAEIEAGDTRAPEGTYR